MSQIPTPVADSGATDDAAYDADDMVGVDPVVHGEDIKAGRRTPAQAAKLFRVSQSTLDRWKSPAAHVFKQAWRL